MRGFIPHTEDDVREMLAKVGVKSLDELFSTVPEDCRWRGDLPLPDGLSEHETARHMRDLAGANRPASDALSFLGGGIYTRTVPALTGQILSRPEFYSAYTPYQPEVSQGTLQSIFEFQTMIARLTGMEAANASMYDGASALAEATLLAGAATRRSRVLLPRSLQPNCRRVVDTYTRGQDYILEDLPYDARGELDVAALESALGDDVAAVIIQSPNYFGVIEDLETLIPRIQAAGALAIVHVEPSSLGILEPPGSFAADIVTGEGQSLGLPMSFGGPLLGIMAVGKKHLRRLPGRLVGSTVDVKGREGYVLTLQTREQHIRREKATSNICTNQGLMMLAATVYLSALGEAGMSELAGNLASGAAGLIDKLGALPGFELAFSGDIYQEFVLRTPVQVAEILEAGRERGILPGIDLSEEYPEFEGRAMLVTVADGHRAEDFDRLADFLGGFAL
jgi:glycine dehydrogenase subunit 1